MNYEENKTTLAIVGAGPKGIAVAVKAKVLQEFGFVVQHIILIEKNAIGANWSGEFGYTNGEIKLSTPPEKDVVFPIEIDLGDNRLNKRIQTRLLHFSWTSFLVHTDRYSDWIDRGRFAPSHKLWADYLRWVAEQLTADISIVYAEVIKIDLTSNRSRWKLELQTSNKENFSIEADRLMLTGPGKARIDFVDQNICPFASPIYDYETFWHALKNNKFYGSGKIAIIGAGEHAASVLLGLSQHAPQLNVDVISSKGFISSRAESFYENNIYSEPDKNCWKELSISDRQDFINRTDLGVFSLQAMNVLNDEIQFRILPGRVVEIKYNGHVISVSVVYNQNEITHIYDQVILATGFDQISVLRSLLSQRAQRALTKALASLLNQQAIAVKIDLDFSVRGMRPYLHLPMFAGLMQGPGFPNLSCLGRLSDRLVTSFVYKKIQSCFNQRG